MIARSATYLSTWRQAARATLPPRAWPSVASVRAWPLALLAVGALALGMGLAVVDARVVGVVHDDAMYVILARALASGEGYRYLNLPGAPAATHFPPGYPAFLAVVSWFAPAFPASVMVFKALNALLLAAAAVFVTRLARERAMSDVSALVLGATCALSVPLLVLGSLVLSEPLFLALVLALLAPLESLAERPGGIARPLLLGLGVAVATLVRSHGIVLVPAVLVLLAARRRWRDAALFGGSAAVALLPWQLWSAAHAGQLPAPLLGNYDSYAAWWLQGLRASGPGMIPDTIARTTSESLQMFAVLFSPLRATVARAATLVALAVLAGAGAWRLRHRLPVTLLFIAGYLAIVLVWPFNPARFLWGIWPLLLLLVGAGAQAAAAMSTGHAPRRIMRPLLLGAFCWVALGYAAYEWRGIRGQWWSSIARANERRIVSAVQWTRRHTAPGDLVAAEDEGAVWLHTGRRAVPVLSFTTAHYLHDRGPAELARTGLQPILDAYPVRVVLVGTRRAVDAADILTIPPAQRLAFRADLPGVAAYLVLPK